MHGAKIFISDSRRDTRIHHFDTGRVTSRERKFSNFHGNIHVPPVATRVTFAECRNPGSTLFLQAGVYFASRPIMRTLDLPGVLALPRRSCSLIIIPCHWD